MNDWDNTAASGEQTRRIERFCADLTELSHRFQLGIGGNPTLFIWQEQDASLHYDCDHASNLVFKEV